MSLKTNIYTDGSCLKNPDGPSGWAYVIVDENNNIIESCSGGEISSTNNRMEMVAVIQALKVCKTESCVIHTDSQLVIKCASGIWNRKKNMDLWLEYNNVSKGKHIEWIWVKGHSGNMFNEHVDKMARNEALKFRT